MPRTDNKRRSTSGEARELLGRLHWQFGADHLEGRSIDYLSLVVESTRELLVDLLPSSADARGAWTSWISSYDVFDVEDFGLYLRDADTLFKNILNGQKHTSGDWTYERFKRSLPHLHARHMACIKPQLEHVLRGGNNPQMVYTINTWFNYLRRCNLPGLDLSARCEAEYVAFEAEMAAWVYDQDLLRSLRGIISEWFKSFDLLGGFRPRHGPGSVSGHSGAIPHFLKYEDCLCADPLLLYLEKDLGSLADWLPWSTTLADNDYAWLRAVEFDLNRGQTTNRVSQLVTVPKSIITNRTISREPALLQYLQQGYRAAVYRHVAMHRYLSQHIKLDDQTLSQALALEGSHNQKYATIDLSSASDSVTTELVKGLFRGCGAFFRALCCTRSRATELPSGAVCTLRKFAPMGSALCFPVESLVFAAAVEYVRRRYRAVFDEERRAHPARCDCRHFQFDWSVYGDDIVVPDYAYKDVVNILERLHFKVNATKSFSGGGPSRCFREACGVEAWNGIDVTPLRVPRFFPGITDTTIESADGVASAVAFINRCFDHGAFALRRLLLARLGKFHSLPFSTDGRKGIKTFADCCTNYRSETRLRLAAEGGEDCYQRPEYKWTQVVVRRDCQTCEKMRRSMGFCSHDSRCTVRTRRVAKSALPHRHHLDLPTPTDVTAQVAELVGTPEDRLLASVETCRYFEWLLLRSEDPKERHNVLDDEDSVVQICPKRATLKRAWHYAQLS